MHVSTDREAVTPLASYVWTVFFVTLARWVVGTGSGDGVRCMYSSGADMNRAPGLVALYLHGTLKSCSSRTFAAPLQVPTWLTFMTTQSPRFRPRTLFSPTVVTSASASFPPTNTSPWMPGNKEGRGFEGYTPSITFTLAGLIGERMRRTFAVCGGGAEAGYGQGAQDI
jgi:hypothetical protein